MKWEREHREEMRATAQFVRLFKDVPDPIVQIADRALTLEARIAWVLLGTCIDQEIPSLLLGKVLSGLFNAFPDDRLWTFPLPTEAEIRQVVRKAKGSYDWSVEESVPGIFWSVGNFVRRRTPLSGWASSTSYKGILRDLGEIFFMGKGAYRAKAILATSRLFSPTPRGLGVPRPENAEEKPPVPFAFGSRRWIGFIGPGQELGFSKMEEPKKRLLGTSLESTLYPRDPRVAAHSFQFFLEPSETGFVCADLTELCTQCPLSSFCPRSRNVEIA